MHKAGSSRKIMVLLEAKARETGEMRRGKRNT